MIGLDERATLKEYIDDPTLAVNLLRQSYREMQDINVCTFGYWPTMSAVKYFLGRCGRGRVIKVLDIGCGDGTLLRRIERYGTRKGFLLELNGIDLSRDVIAAARQPSAGTINFIHGDIFGHQGTYDIIINSLTAHHLTDGQVGALVAWMKEHARVGWAISDLHRHSIPYYFITHFTRLKKYSRATCHDAPLSVARGFRRGDWLQILSRAAISPGSVRISWYPNFRYGIRYEKPA